MHLEALSWRFSVDFFCSCAKPTVLCTGGIAITRWELNWYPSVPGASALPFHQHFSCPSSDCWWRSSQVLLLEVLRVSLICAGEQSHLMQHFRKILSFLHLCPNLPPSPPLWAWVHCCCALLYTQVYTNNTILSAVDIQLLMFAS